MSTALEQKIPKLLRNIALVAAANIVLVATIFYMQTHKKEPAYFLVGKQASGQLAQRQMAPLVSPIINRQALLNWAAEAASSAYTYDQANYQSQIQATIDRYFTAGGGDSFRQALQQSGVLNQLVREQLQVSAVVQEQPVILATGRLLGRYVWKIQLPLLVTYQTASERQQYRFIVTMLVVQVPTWKSANAIGIDQIGVKRAI
jgi:intracellular multiplication protein IcmL